MGVHTTAFSLEIWDPKTCKKLADLSGRATNRKVRTARNEPDQIEWSLDRRETEEFCRESNLDINDLLSAGRRDVRVKYRGNYLASGRIFYRRAGKSNNQISLRAYGIDMLWNKRFTSAEYMAMDAGEIAWALINDSQNFFGTLGVKRGRTHTSGLWNKTYDREAVIDLIKDLAESATRGFDYEFKGIYTGGFPYEFSTYTSIGSDRSNSVKFTSPGNIIDWDTVQDFTPVENQVIGIGSGNGKQIQDVSTQDNTPSQRDYGVLQKFLPRSSDDDQDGSLTDAVKAELAAAAFPNETPSIIVDATSAPFIGTYGKGDLVSVRINDSDLARHVSGAYAIEAIDLTIDDRDKAQAAISLKV